MNPTDLSHVHLIEALQKHNTELMAQYQQYFLVLQQKNVLIARYITALTDRIFEMRKIVDIALLSGNNQRLAYEKIQRLVISLYNEKHTSLLNVSIQELANLCANDIITYLKDTYPALNHDELNICSYICLNFTSDQIRYILNYQNEHSIYNKRHKIRCKINNCSQKELDVILKDMVKERLQQ